MIILVSINIIFFNFFKNINSLNIRQQQTNKIRVLKQITNAERTKNPIFNKSQSDLYSTQLNESLKNKQREGKIKEIFSSQGVISSTMDCNRNESPSKLKSKITSKEFNLTIFETNLNSQQEVKKYRRNSLHTFHNRSGFYME